jgi:tetratricopeptide (TPR) repeat protein
MSVSPTDPLVRRAAEGVPASEGDDCLGHCSMTVRAVRIETALVLCRSARPRLEPARLYRAAVAELEASYRANDDRVEGRVGMGDLLGALGRSDEAESAYRSALALDASAVPAAVNLADFYRRRSDEAQAEAVLREALARSPGTRPRVRFSLAQPPGQSEALALLACGKSTPFAPTSSRMPSR